MDQTAAQSIDISSFALIFMLMFSGMPALIGTTLIIVGVSLIIKKHKRRKRCTLPIIATVVNLANCQSIDDNNNPSDAIIPIFEYSVQNITYRRQPVYGGTGAGYGIGQKIDLLVDPNEPSEYYYAKEKTGIFSAFFIIVGAIFLANAASMGYALYNTFMGPVAP